MEFRKVLLHVILSVAMETIQYGTKTNNLTKLIALLMLWVDSKLFLKLLTKLVVYNREEGKLGKSF